MLDIHRHHQLAEFGASMARSYSTAAMRAFIATASHGLLLWSSFLAASAAKSPTPDWQSPTAMVEQVMRMSPFGWMTAHPAARAPAAFASVWPWGASAQEAVVEDIAPGRTEALPSPPPFASYRSAGGHATAQIIMAPQPKA